MAQNGGPATSGDIGYDRIEFGETAANRLNQRLRDILRLLLFNPKMGSVVPLLVGK